MYQKLTEEKLKGILDEVFNKPRIREFIVHSSCKTYGMIDLVNGPLCSDETCTTCFGMRKSLEEEINKM